MIFSADETTDIGYESGTAVSDLGHYDHDHFIDPDERLRIAMARQ